VCWCAVKKLLTHSLTPSADQSKFPKRSAIRDAVGYPIVSYPVSRNCDRQRNRWRNYDSSPTSISSDCLTQAAAVQWRNQRRRGERVGHKSARRIKKMLKTRFPPRYKRPNESITEIGTFSFGDRKVWPMKLIFELDTNLESRWTSSRVIISFESYRSHSALPGPDRWDVLSVTSYSMTVTHEAIFSDCRDDFCACRNSQLSVRRNRMAAATVNCWSKGVAATVALNVAPTVAPTVASCMNATLK